MRIGWSCREAAIVLNIHPNKIPQSLNPAIDKIARLFRADPVKTMEAIMDAAKKLEPMTPEEVLVRHEQFARPIRYGT